MQGDASIEEWELFADPRELERRKAERRRAALPPEVRVQRHSAWEYGSGPAVLLLSLCMWHHALRFFPRSSTSIPLPAAWHWLTHTDWNL